jgi:hypothetical protein
MCFQGWSLAQNDDIIESIKRGCVLKLSEICLLVLLLVGLAVATTNEAFAQRGGGIPMGPQSFTHFQLATLSEV